MVRVLIALGSNVGDRLANLQEATVHLADVIDVLSASHVYETAPMYVVDQPAFLNAAVLAQTSLGPRELLCRLKAIEGEMGRERRSRNGPREIDLDLIGFGSAAYKFTNAKQLTVVVPHPRVGERRFVLQPLFDVAPDSVLPGVGSVSELLRQTEDQAKSVKKVEHAILPIQRLE